MKKQKIILTLFILCSLALLLFLILSMQPQTNYQYTDMTSVSTEESTLSDVESLSNEKSTLSDNISLYTEENTLSDSESFSTECSSTDSELSEVLLSKRTTYMPDFYYEPLSESIINRIYGISYKIDCPISYDDLRYVHILHINFNQEVTEGELICNQDIAQDMVEIFYELYIQHYQIEKVRLVDEYNADDKLSMMDNNTSCFNYRTVEGTNSISKHGLGLAIDINPFYNPYVTTNSDGTTYISPPGSEIYVDRANDFAHKITENDLCYQLFTEHGFLWGGHWKYTKDYQHFYKEP